MINIDKYVVDFVAGNWLSMSVLFLILKGVAKQFGIGWLHKVYFIGQNAWSIVRPGTAKDTLAKVEAEKKA